MVGSLIKYKAHCEYLLRKVMIMLYYVVYYFTVRGEFSRCTYVATYISNNIHIIIIMYSRYICFSYTYMYIAQGIIVITC